jgi:hypothetical protein
MNMSISITQQKFYFTYGTSETQPFYGGWTEVIAEDFDQAIERFYTKHPMKTPGIINCAFMYTEEEFKKTDMFKKGNIGCRCHEIIESDPLKTYEFDTDSEETWLMEDFLDDFRMDMHQMNPNGSWHAEGINIGWRKLSGYKDFSTTDAEELIQYIAPKTQSYRGQCRVYDYHIELTLYHHDAPTGESYTIIPSKE